MAKADKQRLSYAFLRSKELAGETFSTQELTDAVGWKLGTSRTYLSKKWTKFVTGKGGSWSVQGIASMTEAQYLNYMSQVATKQESAFQSELPPKVEALIYKATEAATLALDVYNRPATKFRTQGYSVLMVIAWTALLHAIFEKREMDYLYRTTDGTPAIADGEPKAWELSQSARAYFGDTQPAMTANLDFMIRLRNKIEHRFVPELDLHVAGECQAMLINFETVLTQEFGDSFSLSHTLCTPLQTSSYTPNYQTQAMKSFQARNYGELRDFLGEYRANLTKEIYSDPKFSFRVYLVPKVGNHLSSSDVAYEFVKYDPSDARALEDIQKRIALIKDRTVPVANQGKYLPKAVVKLVAEATGGPFTMQQHTRAWKLYEVRREGPAEASGCKPEFCQFDEAHRGYIYTQAWVDMLIKKVSDQKEWERLQRARR